MVAERWVSELHRELEASRASASDLVRSAEIRVRSGREEGGQSGKRRELSGRRVGYAMATEG